MVPVGVPTCTKVVQPAPCSAPPDSRHRRRCPSTPSTTRSPDSSSPPSPPNSTAPTAASCPAPPASSRSRPPSSRSRLPAASTATHPIAVTASPALSARIGEGGARRRADLRRSSCSPRPGSAPPGSRSPPTLSVDAVHVRFTWVGLTADADQARRRRRRRRVRRRRRRAASSMSVWISACVNARLYTRTSSINPSKYSP